MAASASTTVTRPKVYYWFWHPHKTWLDILLGLITSLLFLKPFHYNNKNINNIKYENKRNSFNSNDATAHTVQSDDTSTSNDTAINQNDTNYQQQLIEQEQLKEARIQYALSLRKQLTKVIEDHISKNQSSGCYQWSKVMKCDIIEICISIPRIDTILQQWNIITEQSDMNILQSVVFPTNTNIKLYVTFPITLLPNDMKVPTKKNRFGCFVYDDDDKGTNTNSYYGNDILQHLSKTIPLIVFFHGGGLTTGTSRSCEHLDAIVCNNNNSTSTAGSGLILKPFIHVNVDYTLAPEYSFPIQIIESCSVLSYILDLNYKNIQISGTSAGAYLALVSSFEAYRYHIHKKNIKSIIASCPMLTPTTDTLHFYINQSSSHVCPVHFLRLCYRSYLNLPESNMNPNQDPTTTNTSKNHVDDNNNHDLSTLLGKNSTRNEYYQSRWYQSKNFRRLIEPICDIPMTFSKDNDNKHRVPTIVITTNQADPLYDGGIALVKALQNMNASIIHHNDRGSHWNGTALDKKAYQKLSIAIRDGIGI